MRKKTRYLPTYISMRLPDDVAQTYYILSDEEKERFEDYYKLFLILPDIPRDIPYQILRMAVTQPTSKEYLENKDIQGAQSSKSDKKSM